MIEMTRKDEIPEIAKRIKQLRKAKKWNQSELAKAAKVTDGAVKMWETGKRFPRGANLKNLATALGVPESAILDDTPPPVSPASEAITPDNNDFKDLIRLLPTLNEHQVGWLLRQALTLTSVDSGDLKLTKNDPKLQKKS